MVKNDFQIFLKDSTALNVELEIENQIHKVSIDGIYIGEMWYDNEHGTGFLTNDEGLKPFIASIEKHLIED